MNRYYRYFLKKDYGLIKNAIYDLLNKFLGFSPYIAFTVKVTGKLPKNKRIRKIKVNKVRKLKRKNINFTTIDEMHEVPIFLKKKMHIKKEKEVSDNES